MSPFSPFDSVVVLSQDDSQLIAENINLVVTLGGLSLMLLSLYLFIKGMFLFSAIKNRDYYFIKEYSSKTRPPLFFVVLGAALFAAGFIVAFVPFSTSVSN